MNDDVGIPGLVAANKRRILAAWAARQPPSRRRRILNAIGAKLLTVAIAILDRARPARP